MNLMPRFFSAGDFEAVMAFLNGRCRHHAPPPYWNTGKHPFGIYLTLFEGKAANHLLWADDTGAIQAYLYLSPDANTPIYFTPEVREWRIFTHPAQRTRPLLDHLIATAEAKQAQRPSQEPLTTVAYEGDVAWTAVLHQHGYVRQDEVDVYMTQSLDRSFPAPTVPEGFVIRPFAGESEIATRAALTDSAFGGFEGPSDWSLTNIGRMLGYCRQKRAVDLVAVTLDGRIVSSAIVHHDHLTKMGEFEPVGTHREYWQRGLAKALLLTGLHWLQGAGMETAVIRTSSDNVAAQHAYQSVGFQITDRLFRYQKGVA